MLEKPELEDQKIIDCLRSEYGLGVEAIAFLPLGADQNTAVYRATTGDPADYFVKLRRGAFEDASVAVPKYLADLGMRHIIPPLATRAGRLWANLPPFKLILYPYVEGRDGFERNLSDHNGWNLAQPSSGFTARNFPFPSPAACPGRILPALARIPPGSSWSDPARDLR